MTSDRRSVRAMVVSAAGPAGSLTAVQCVVDVLPPPLKTKPAAPLFDRSGATELCLRFQRNVHCLPLFAPRNSVVVTVPVPPWTWTCDSPGNRLAIVSVQNVNDVGPAGEAVADAALVQLALSIMLRFVVLAVQPLPESVDVAKSKVFVTDGSLTVVVVVVVVVVAPTWLTVLTGPLTRPEGVL